MGWPERIGMPLRWLVVAAFAGVTLASWLPILAVIATLATVMATGCQVNEAESHPCVVAGHDIGDALGTGILAAFVAGPCLLVAIGCTIVWIVLWRRRSRASLHSA